MTTNTVPTQKSSPPWRCAAEAVVERVADIRACLGLPTHLRSIEDMIEDDLSEIASDVYSDGFMANTPAALDATEGDLEEVLREAW